MAHELAAEVVLSPWCPDSSGEPRRCVVAEIATDGEGDAVLEVGDRHLRLVGFGDPSPLGVAALAELLRDDEERAGRRTGIHRDLEATLKPSGTGRPRQLKVDVFLAGVLLTVGDKRPLTLVNVHATLTKNLALSARIALGTEYRPSPDADPRSLSIRQVRYLLEAIERKLAYTEGRRPDLASEDRDARAQALQHVLDKIIDASLPEHLPRPASIALDGTVLESWARGKKRSTGAASAATDPATGKTSTGPEEHGLDAIGGEGYSFDPDARWGYRTRTYDNKSTRCFGYELYNLVGVPEVGEDPSALPKLTYALTLRPLATDVVEPGLALLDHLIARGHELRLVVNDRAWSYMSAERWLTSSGDAASTRCSTFTRQIALSATSRASP